MKPKSTFLLIFIILIGVLLRLLPLNTGIDADEAVTIFIANSGSVAELVDRTRLYEFAPPLYFALISIWVHLFGDSTLAVAVPSMVLGVGLIPCVYLLAIELFERQDIALTSAFFASISPLGVVFSREARSSSLIALLGTLTFYFFVRCLKATRRPRLLALGISTTLLLYSNYVSILLVILMGINTVAYTKFPFKSIVFKHERILATLVFSLLAFLPWMPIFFDQQKYGSFPYDRESSGNLLLIMVSNLAATLPLPYNASFTLLFIALPIFALMLGWKAMVLLFRRELVTYIDHHKAYTLLLANILLPVFTYKYLAPLVGSQRYVMSFVFFGWILCAALAVELVSQVGIRLARRSPLQRNLTIALICSIMVLITYSEVKGMSQEDDSGLRKFARDWQSNKFKQSAVMMAPDFNSYTLVYYIQKEQHGQAPSLYYGFPNHYTQTPAKLKDYTAGFADKQALDNALEWIKKIDITQAQSLVLITDESEPGQKLRDSKDRQQELVDAIAARYPIEGEPEVYSSSGRSFKVRVFKLSEPPD